MIRFLASLHRWGTPGFADALRGEIERLPSDELPLQESLSVTSHVADAPHQAAILDITEQGHRIRARVGIFFGGIVAGCNCADDPTPVDIQSEYCKLEFDIDKRTGVARVTVVR